MQVGFLKETIMWIRIILFCHLKKTELSERRVPKKTNILFISTASIASMKQPDTTVDTH